MKVLIADDDAVSRYILQRILETLGYEVVACENGSDALGKYLAGNFHLVISDWMMPNLDGLELCRKIRESKRPEYCYFILQTAHAQKEDLLDSLDFGVDDYLSKPFDSNDLKLRLKIADKVLKLQAYAQSFMKAASNCPVCNENHETLSPHLPQSA